MIGASSDRNLLFGILAVQLDFVTQDALIAAMNAWLLDKSKPLEAILHERGSLSDDELQHLSGLVNAHLKRHGNDAEKSLAALSSVDPRLRQDLAGVTDADLQKSLLNITTQRSTRGADPNRTIDASPTGETIRYRILRPHKKGGLGEVFVAEDTELGRHVALKEIQLQFADDATSRSRFVLEAEVTGGLEHPGIVPVYGLGTYADGRPFYAMRLIPGDNLGDAIRQFHDVGRASQRERDVDAKHVALTPRRSPTFASLEFRQLLQRFIDVCNAVAYAHSRGVLHRDLKPGNVMLGKYGETMVVDWGLARIAGGRDEQSKSLDQELFLRPRSSTGSSGTVQGKLLGTPAYMPPEQAEGRWDLLSASSDVYSLGATLYHLLTGTAPFHGSEDEVLAAVRRGEFRAPRRVNPAIPRALDAVCLKAMALKPEDRYASALELAKEIERWLADEPVAALKEPITARARRWVRKHSRLTTGLAAALLVGALGMGALAWQREQARKSIADEQAETTKERDRANEHLVFAKKGNELLGSVFAGLNPRRIAKSGRPLQDLLKDNLSKAVQELEGTAVGDPLAVTDMQMTLGISLNSLGLFEQAAAVFEKVRNTRESRLGHDHPDTLSSMSNLAESYFDLGRHAEAKALFEETLKLRRSKLGPDHPDTLKSMGNLANSSYILNRHGEALALHEETLKLMKAKLGPDHPDTLSSMSNLAANYSALGRVAEALSLFEETLKLMKAKLGPDHPDTLLCMNNLAASYTILGRHAESLALNEETLKLRKAKLGADHPDTLVSRQNLANSYADLGRHAEALAYDEETLKLYKAKFGPDHPETLQIMNNLAESYVTANRTDDALALIDDTLPRAIRKPGVHPRVVPSLINSRLRAMVKNHDAAGCRATAEMREKLNRTDAAGLFVAACFRSICAAIMREKKEIGADEQADKAMDWLKKAVAAGFKDVDDMKKNKDLDALRMREDFKALIADLETTGKPTPKPNDGKP